MKHFRLNANVKFQFYFGFPINTKLLSLNMTILVDIKKMLIMINTSLEGILLQVFRMRIYTYIYIYIKIQNIIIKNRESIRDATAELQVKIIWSCFINK